MRIHFFTAPSYANQLDRIHLFLTTHGANNNTEWFLIAFMSSHHYRSRPTFNTKNIANMAKKALK